MNHTQYESGYREGFARTVRSLLSRGVPGYLAEEISQDAWCQGWKRRDQLRDARCLLAWINAIAWNYYRNLFRYCPQPSELTETCAISTTEVESDAKIMLARCSPKERRLLNLYYIEGYRVKEIAVIERASEEAVRLRLMRVRDSVRRKLRLCQRPRTSRQDARPAAKPSRQPEQRSRNKAEIHWSLLAGGDTGDGRQTQKMRPSWL